MDITARLKIKIENLFPEASEREKASVVLARYGEEEYEQESDRVRLAILKLAGPNPSIAKLQEFTNAAKGDFRDVLAWAEYPRQSRRSSAKGAVKLELANADLEEYETWLNT